MRKTFTMTKLQHAALMNACRPVPAMWIGGPPRSVQQNANDAWIALGREMGFDGMTVRPGSHELEFTAEEAAITAAPSKSPADLEYESWTPGVKGTDDWPWPVGVVALGEVIRCLRETGRFVDEEGELTNALEELLRRFDGADGVPPSHGGQQ